MSIFICIHSLFELCFFFFVIIIILFEVTLILFFFFSFFYCKFCQHLIGSDGLFLSVSRYGSSIIQCRGSSAPKYFFPSPHEHGAP